MSVAEERMPPVGRIGRPPEDIEPARTDIAGSGPSGTLAIGVHLPRRVWRDENLGGRSDPNETVLPLVAVNGRAVDLGQGRALVSVPAGRASVEVMDDHRYDSRTVDVAEDGSVDMWIGATHTRQNHRIMMGPRGYAAWATTNPMVPKVRAGAVGFAVAAVLVLVLGPLAAATAPALTALVLPVAIVAGVAPYRGLRRRFQRRYAADLADPADFPGPQAVAPGPDPDRTVCALGPRVAAPDQGPAVVLRFAPDPSALKSIEVSVASRTGKVLKPYISNDFVDWLAAPEVRVDGESICSRWGTLWIPVRPGRLAIEVRMPGFSDPRRRDAVAVLPSQASIELEVTGTQEVDCFYNIVRLAADRTAGDPRSESAWQQVLRRRHRLKTAERRADAPVLRLEAAASNR